MSIERIFQTWDHNGTPYSYLLTIFASATHIICAYLSSEFERKEKRKIICQYSLQIVTGKISPKRHRSSEKFRE